MNTYRKIVLAFLTIAGLHNTTNAQEKNDWKQDKKVAVVFGLSQLLVTKGFNIEGNYIHKRLIFDYSHGFSLDLENDLLSPNLKAQGVVVHLPFSVGVGVGYRFTEWLNLRVEPKWHKFEFYYAGEAQTTANRIAVDEHNFSLGLGLYGFIQPFKRKNNVLKGLTIAPSIRYWPTVSSSFADNKFGYQNKLTNKTEVIPMLAAGYQHTPTFINISVGYAFDLKRR
jgi:hypothetical protein